MFTFLKSPRKGLFGDVWVRAGVGSHIFSYRTRNFWRFGICSKNLVWSGLVCIPGFTVLGPVLQHVVSMANFGE